MKEGVKYFENVDVLEYFDGMEQSYPLFRSEMKTY
jgi:hypothetical protein